MLGGTALAVNTDSPVTTRLGEGAKARSAFLLLIRLVIGAILLLLIATKVPLGQLTVHWTVRTFEAFGVVFLLQLLAQWLSSVRWRLIVGPGAPSLGYLYRLYLISNFFSIFLPTSIGGDVVRALSVAPSIGGKARATATVFMDRVWGMLALGSFFFLGLAVTGSGLPAIGEVRLSLPRWATSGWMLATVALFGFGAVAVGLRTAVGAATLNRVREAVGPLMRSPGRMVGVGASAVAVQGTYIVAWTVLAFGCGFQVPAAQFLVYVPLVSVGSMLPVTFSGLGVREGAWLLLLSSFSIARPDIVVFSLLYFLAFVLVGGVGGVLFLIRGTASRPSGPSMGFAK